MRRVPGTEVLWLNGRFVAARAARISPLDRGLLHGDGVYDTWRTYGGVPFALAAHRSRLAAAARVLGLARPEPATVWNQRTRALLRRNRLADGAVRLTITRGAGGVGPLPDRNAPPLRLLTIRPLPPNLVAMQTHGIAAVLLPFGRDIAPAWGGLKLIGHPSLTIGRRLAARRRAAEGFYVNDAGEVTEATTANVAIIERDRLVTPPLSAGILGGVTRAIVLRLARQIGLAVREESVPTARLRRARECFITASTIEVVPIVRLDGRPVAGGTPGDATRALQIAYTAEVARRLRPSRP